MTGVQTCALPISTQGEALERLQAQTVVPGLAQVQKLKLKGFTPITPMPITPIPFIPHSIIPFFLPPRFYQFIGKERRVKPPKRGFEYQPSLYAIGQWWVKIGKQPPSKKVIKIGRAHV